MFRLLHFLTHERIEVLVVNPAKRTSMLLGLLFRRFDPFVCHAPKLL